jgi:hypothetical protein
MEIAHWLASESERIRLEGGGAKKYEPGTQPAIKENLERSSIFSYLVLFKSNSPQEMRYSFFTKSTTINSLKGVVVECIIKVKVNNLLRLARNNSNRFRLPHQHIKRAVAQTPRSVKSNATR